MTVIQQSPDAHISTTAQAQYLTISQTHFRSAEHCVDEHVDSLY